SWNHVVVAYGHSISSDGDRLVLYVKGVYVWFAYVTSGDLDVSTSCSRNIQHGSTGGTFLGCGYDNSTLTYNDCFDGVIDEFTIWNKALSATEVRNLYARGAANVKYQVRSCNDAACSGESFVGPDNTSGTFFDET